jgi:hypothetical protein
MKCLECQAQDPTLFTKCNRTNRKPSFQARCITCQRKYCKQNYLQNKKKILKKQRIRKQEQSNYINKIKSDSPCTDCKKFWPPYIMDFDHLPGSKKLNDVASMKHYTIERIQQEIAKCELVCSNCHRERTFQRKMVPKRGIEPL